MIILPIPISPYMKISIGKVTAVNEKDRISGYVVSVRGLLTFFGCIEEYDW